tara:strand:+ start:308 stop:523 length:216 start_codon:yes stop_codon:yes gene_type:complete
MGKKLLEAGHEYLPEAVISGVTGGVIAEAPYFEVYRSCLLLQLRHHYNPLLFHYYYYATLPVLLNIRSDIG